MEYTCYKDAYDALVKDNDGVLPDLYEITDIIISNNICNLAGKLTVADVVAHALVEMSTSGPVKSDIALIRTEQLYLPITASEPLQLDKLLDQAIVSVN